MLLFPQILYPPGWKIIAYYLLLLLLLLEKKTLPLQISLGRLVVDQN